MDNCPFVDELSESIAMVSMANRFLKGTNGTGTVEQGTNVWPKFFDKCNNHLVKLWNYQKNNLPPTCQLQPKNWFKGDVEGNTPDFLNQSHGLLPQKRE